MLNTEEGGVYSSSRKQLKQASYKHPESYVRDAKRASDTPKIVRRLDKITVKILTAYLRNQ